MRNSLVLRGVAREVLVEGPVVVATSIVEDVLPRVHLFDSEKIEFPEIGVQMLIALVLDQFLFIVGIEAVVFVAEEAVLLLHLFVEVDFLLEEKLLFQIPIPQFLFLHRPPELRAFFAEDFLRKLFDEPGNALLAGEKGGNLKALE